MNNIESKKDAENLMNGLLPLAKRMLREFEGFHPYGGYMKHNGEIVEIGIDTPFEEMPASKDLIRTLQNSLHKLARQRQCKATGIVFDVLVPSPVSGLKTDAVQISLDHLGGYSADVFLPYEKKGTDLVWGKVFSQEGDHKVFKK